VSKQCHTHSGSVDLLDVRFYPLATIDTERYELDDRVHSALRHMVNLEQLVWTVSLFARRKS